MQSTTKNCGVVAVTLRDRGFELSIYEAGAKDREGLAAYLGVKYDTLKSQINPDNEVAHLQARYLPALIQYANDDGPIHALCRLRGLVAFEMPDVEASASCMGALLAEEIEAFGELLKGHGDCMLSDIKREDYEQTRANTYYLIQTLLRYESAMKEMMERPAPRTRPANRIAAPPHRVGARRP